MRPVAGYRLTSRFGDRGYMWSSGMHTGLDFAAPTGTPDQAEIKLIQLAGRLLSRANALGT